ncbi:MAG: cytochrome c [Novosphingobium sp.]|nr:cytochrome c [Novosphingobium sp.]
MRLVFTTITVFIATAAVALAASPTAETRTRIAGYRALGAAFKSANDLIRRRDHTSPKLREAAATIVSSAKSQYRWYPSSSGPKSGLKTAAKAEIWSNPGEFRKLQDRFLTQAQAFQAATASNDPARIRTEVRKLGASCKACHDRFRNSDD